MKQKNKKIIAIAIIAIIILAGIVVVNIWGFNKELKYEESQTINVYLEQQFDDAKVKSIVNDVLGTKNMMQTVEIYGDMITIRAKSISEEQKNAIVNKLKENYEFKQTIEETTINRVPITKIRDMYKPYVMPFIITAVLVAGYMGIRYYKKGMLKVISKTIIVPVVAELLLFSIIAITRIPMGRFVPLMVILVYIASILGVIKNIEK